MEETQQRLKFYADTPRGERNKAFSYPVKDIDHAIDRAAYFVQELRFEIRAAYYQNLKGKSMRLDKGIDLKTYPRRVPAKNKFNSRSEEQ